MSDLIITVNDVTTIHDETDGLQNTPPNLDATTDDNGNDIAVGQLPSVFFTRLNNLGADPSGAIGAALSGYDGANAGEDVFTVSGSGEITNLALTDTNGDPLDGLDSGLKTTDGENSIFLYTDPTNDNIVLGREGTGTTADPNGNIALAIYLDEADDLTSAKIWTVQYEAIFHDVPGDGTTPQGSYDEPLDLTDKLFVTAREDLTFDLTGVPSGNNLFITYGDGIQGDDETEVAIVATGLVPADESAGENVSSGDTVNTSQADPPTSFSSNSQNITPGNGVTFTFVEDPNPDFTVAPTNPRLSSPEARVEENIQFTDVFDSTGAQFDVVKFTSGNPTATLKLTTFAVDHDPTAPIGNPGNLSQDNFIDSDGLTGNLDVNILSATVIKADGNTATTTVTISGNMAIITGVEEGDTIEYTTDGVHNRVAVENAGDATTAPFNIGNFELTGAEDATAEVGSTVYWEDDGPQIDLTLVANAMLQTDDGDLEGGNSGDGIGTDTDSAGLGDLFNVTSAAGTDGEDSTVYALELGSNTTTSVVDTATGETVVLSLNAGVVEGRTDTSDLLVFSLSVNSGTGEVTLEQFRAVEHSQLDREAPYNDDITGLGVSDAVNLSATITDGDGDTATDSIDISSTIKFTDDGPQIDLTLVANAMLQTDDGGLAGGNAGGVTTDSAGLGELFNVTESAGADGDGGTIYSLVLGTNTTTSLQDSATDETVVLSLNGGVVEGRTETSDDLVFTLSVDSATGEVTLTQSRAVEHSVAETEAPYNNDITGLGVIDAVNLSATITDGDGDTATDAIDISSTLKFTDDGPELEFGDLIGTVTTATQTGFWSDSPGADQPATVSISAGSTFEMVTPDGVSSTGTVTFDPNTGTGTLTADFDNDPTTGVNGNETIGFTLTVNSDGTYDFTLDEVIVPVVVLDTSEGQLPAGGPDPVQTLTFGMEPDTTDFVFFAVDADTATSGGAFGPTDIVPAIELGEPDLTEAELEAGAAPPIGDNTFPFIREEIEMNVSTSGIGVGNNVLQGEDLPGDTPGTINSFDSGAFDESFVINPEPLASSIKVFVSSTAGGFEPPGSGATPAKTDYLYWNLYDELGNNSGPNLVEFADVTDEGSFRTFIIDIDDVAIAGDFIDAVQFTMGFGDIKIPKIEVVVRGNTPPNDILLDFQAKITDADGDMATSDFAVDLFGYEPTENPEEFDYLLQGGTLGSSPEAFNALDQADPLNDYLIQDFDTTEDTLVLNNLASTYTLDTSSDQGVGDPLVNDSLITSDTGSLRVIVADATLALGNIVG